MYQHRSSISETLFSPIHIKTHYQLIYALSITVCFVTKGFKVVLTGKIVFTLLSCHPLILFTISWIANTKKNNKVLNIYYPRYTCCSPIMKNVFCTIVLHGILIIIFYETTLLTDLWIYSIEFFIVTCG